MMNRVPPPHLQALLDLESRHDELLDRLDELDQRVTKTLAECAALREPSSSKSARKETASQDRSEGSGRLARSESS